MHFIHKILYFEEFLHKIALFFKKLVFPGFQSIESVSRPIEIAIKIYAWLCVFRSIEPIFRSIKNRIESFLKPLFITCSSLFKLFKNTFSLYSIGLRLLARFLSFSSKIFARFFSSKAGKTFLPFLLHLFSCFMH